MMKKSLILLFIVSFTMTKLLAQQPWAAPGATWYYSYNGSFWPFSGYQKIEKSGDTLISGINCDNFLTTVYGYNYLIGNFTSDTTHEFAYISQDTLYYWFENQFRMIGNFGAAVGDNWVFPSGNCVDSNYFHVDSIGQKIISSDTLKVLYLTEYVQGSSFSGVTLTEKIGFNTMMFPYYYCLIDFDLPGPFRCYFDSSGFTYSSNIAPSCDFTIGIKDINSGHTSLISFPNPITDMLTLTLPGFVSESDCSINVYDAFGRTVSLKDKKYLEGKLILDLSNLTSGFYLVRLTNGFESYEAKVLMK